MITLGIETSCDETALALIETRDGPQASSGSAGDFECRVIASLVHSQAELHSAYGGVFPTLAKREHGRNLVPLLEKLLKQAALAGEKDPGKVAKTDFGMVLNSFRDEFQSQNPDLWESLIHADFLKHIPAIDRIAVTEGPGLEPALWVGINFARFLSVLWKVPLIPVNHMEGHIVASLIDENAAAGSWQRLKRLDLPAIALLISGGHTELVNISKIGSYKIIGQTKDDAVGEAFDKAARLLGLPYPGGPHIGKLSHEAYLEKIASPVKLPRPMLHSGDLDFSFSGLKTAVLYAVRDHSGADGKLTDEFKKGLAHEFEQAVADTLDAKLRKAIDEISAKSIIIGGGVSANHVLRERFTATAHEYAVPIFLPSRHLSGDNALMIALAGAIDSSAHPNAIKACGTKRLGI